MSKTFIYTPKSPNESLQNYSDNFLPIHLGCIISLHYIHNTSVPILPIIDKLIIHKICNKLWPLHQKYSHIPHMCMILPCVWVLWSLKVIYRLPFNCVTLIHLIDFYNAAKASDMWQHLILLFHPWTPFTSTSTITSRPSISLPQPHTHIQFTLNEIVGEWEGDASDG